MSDDEDYYEDEDNTNNRTIRGVAREHKKIHEVTYHTYNK
jgi:hypothetical protein